MKKIETKHHYSNNELLERQQAGDMIQSSVIDPIQLEVPGFFKLNVNQKHIFSALINLIDSEITPVSHIDALELVQLAIELDLINEATTMINSQGLLIENKKNPAIAVRNNSLKNVQNLLSDLNLTLNKRIGQMVNLIQSNSVDDPIKDLLGA